MNMIKRQPISIVTVRNEVAKVMFLQVSVCPQGGEVCPRGVHGPGVHGPRGVHGPEGLVPGSQGGGEVGIPACTETDPLG